MFEPIMPGARASALTNFLKLEEPSEQAAQKLLDYLSVQQMPWQPDVVNLDSFQKKNPAQPINNLKRNIATSMGNGIRPESIPFILNKKNKQQYYYLRPGHSNDIQVPYCDADVILKLGMIASLLGETEFGIRKPHAFMIGPYIHVGARAFTTKKGVSIVEAFRLDLAFSYNQFQIVLSAQAFKNEDNSIISGDVALPEKEELGLTLSLIQTERLQKLDGRKNKLPDITFNDKDIRQSRLYLLNRLTEFFSSIFTKVGIAHSRVIFEPTYVTSEPHIRLDAINRVRRDLIIINNTGIPLSVSDQSDIIAALSEDNVQFDAYNFYHDGRAVSNDAWLDELRPQDALLVINKASNDDNDSSIRVEDESLRRPWDAYHALANNMASREDVDPYTWLKYSRLYKRGGGASAIDIPVMQGINITTTDVIDVACKKEAFRRCAVELAIKNCYAIGTIPLSPFTPEGAFTLLFVDSVFLQESGEYKKPLYYLALVRIEIFGGKLTIVDSDFHPEISMEEKESLRRRFPCLKSFQGDSMYVIDESSGRYLRRFSGSFVPKIILNSRYPSIECALATIADTGGLNSKGFYSRSRKSALLPFYLPPAEDVAEDVRWRDSSFVEDKGKFVRYFVPSKQAVQSSFGFSNLHDLMVFAPEATGKNGEISFSIVGDNLLEEPLVQLYLSTLTTGILRLKENSKASLLDKLVSLAGMDPVNNSV
ncbi:hypothetical protein [Pluralibacter gergoviae]|uniref:hypothetical protein n=1 Tax=Pluralibacter gergoviae TaxID=61647 RepID=UPI000A374107|nr:hypothetical protein [Pluralibacter gergoviae]OUF43960.1 hypothetical protein AZ034_004632 [Pluralibacter gergoviae]OUF55715.1 hypothetical protein AZ044_001972 [Pluralibacter gergoviae]